MSITVVARARAKVGCERNLEAAWRAVVVPTHAEEGCELYSFHRSTQDPRLMLTLERWSTPAALERHLASPHMQALLQKVPDWVEGAPEIQVFECVPTGGPKGTF